MLRSLLWNTYGRLINPTDIDPSKMLTGKGSIHLNFIINTCVMYCIASWECEGLSSPGGLIHLHTRHVMRGEVSQLTCEGVGARRTSGWAGVHARDFHTGATQRTGQHTLSGDGGGLATAHTHLVPNRLTKTERYHMCPGCRCLKLALIGAVSDATPSATHTHVIRPKLRPLQRKQV